jgi:probable HAF family extracellular repeat protein
MERRDVLRISVIISATVLSLMVTTGWSQAPSLTWLGTLGGDRSWAIGVSADGAVVVGVAYNTDAMPRAFRWTASGGMQDLGTLGGAGSESWSISADGAVVVGMAQNAAGHRRAFRWTEEGMQDLGTLGGRESYARSVSADGAVVVGLAQNAEGRRCAFRWMLSRGMEDLSITYAHLLTPGSYLIAARSISPDGRYIVGYGYNATTERIEAYLLDTGFPLQGDVDRNNCVDDTDLQRVLFAFGEQGYRNEDLNWDGTIDDADLLLVLFNFGSGC